MKMADTTVLHTSTGELPATGITPPVKRRLSAEPPLVIGVR